MPLSRRPIVRTLCIVVLIYFLGLLSNLLSLAGARREATLWVTSELSAAPQWLRYPGDAVEYLYSNRYHVRVPRPTRARLATLPAPSASLVSRPLLCPFLLPVEYAFVDAPARRYRSGGGVRIYASFFGLRRAIFMQDLTQFHSLPGA